MKPKPGTSGAHTSSEVDEARKVLRAAHDTLEAVEVVRDEAGRLTAATVDDLVEAADAVRRLVFRRCCDGQPCELSRLIIEEQFRRVRSGHGGTGCCAPHQALAAAVFGRGWPRQYRDEVTIA